MHSPESMSFVERLMVGTIPAVIALFAGLIGGYLTGRRESRFDYRKWLRSRADDLAKDARVAVANLTQTLGAATHATAWLTWKACKQEGGITVDDIVSYDEEMHSLFPSISGSLALVAALDESLYGKMESLTKQVYALDEKIALAGIAWRKQPEEGIKLLVQYYDEAIEFSKSLNQRVADIFHEQAQSLEARYSA